MSFEQKMCAMSAREILLTLIDAVENPVIRLDMDYFGRIDDKGVCIACAATNTIAKIAGVTFTQSNIVWVGDRAKAIQSDYNFIVSAEWVLDDLRKGNVEAYNTMAQKIGIAEIVNYDDIDLPEITNDNYTDPATLEPYKRLADLQN